VHFSEMTIFPLWAFQGAAPVV